MPLRLALFYAAFFPTYGIYIPFLPSYLAGKGMTAEEIGYLLGAIQISRLIGNPLIARAADAWGEARRPLIILTLRACWALPSSSSSTASAGCCCSAWRSVWSSPPSGR